MPQPGRLAMGGGGGPSKQATFAGTAQDAFNQALRAIAASGGEVQAQHPPQGARFQIGYKNIWSTMGTTLKYDGDVQIAPAGPGQVTARFGLKLQWASIVPLMAVVVAVAIIGAMTNYLYAAYFLFILIVGVGYNAWAASSRFPEKILEDIIKNLQAGGAYAPAPQPQYAPQPAAPAYTPQPATPAPIPTPTPAPAASNGGDSATIVDQIKQLAALRDAGAITPEEFEAKKTELLKRI